PSGVDTTPLHSRACDSLAGRILNLSTVIAAPGRLLKKSTSVVLASYRSSTYQMRISEVGSTGGAFRSPRSISSANGLHRVQSVPPRAFTRSGLAGQPF